MEKSSIDNFHEHLLCEDKLNLSWQALTEPCGLIWLAHLNDSNATLLNVISAMEEQHAELFEEQGALGQEMLRIDAKLNFLLHLVGRLVAVGQSLPQAVLLHFNAHGISWESEVSMPVGANGLVLLHLPPFLMSPLQLPGEVVQCEDKEGITRVTFIFNGLSEPVQEAIDRLVFRHHRRQVAVARQAPRT